MCTKQTNRCDWCGHDPLYVAYHDDEWGRPEYDSRALWEKLTLEGFQAGLSWITILRKRDAFRGAFCGFDPKIVGAFNADDVDRLLSDRAIVRHRGKIQATIAGAQAWQALDGDQGFANYMWNYVDGRPIQNEWHNSAQIPAQSKLSGQISADLNKKGFKFCGPTIVYAFMQASGMVNDHLVHCHCYEKVRALGTAGPHKQNKGD